MNMLPAPTPRRAGFVVLAFGLALIAITKFMDEPRAKPVFCEKDKQPTAKTVVMLSASWCGYCAQARQLFVKQGIDYCEYDIEQSAAGAARHQALGVRGVPAILVGNETLLGFDRNAVLESIRSQGLAPAPH